MEKSIIINRNQLPIKEYKGQRVVTFKDIDMVHGRPDGTAGRNFRRNKSRFIEGTDYFKIQPDEIRPFGITSPNGGIVVTESGYLMLAKSFTDDLAWTVQRELVNNYFRVSKGVAKRDVPTTRGVQLTLETAEYHYFDKTYKGEPVITLDDFEHFTGILHHSVYFYIKRLCKQNEDYLIISGDEAANYKMENPGVNKLMRAVVLLKASAVRKLLDYFKLSVKIPMIEQKKERRHVKLPSDAMKSLMGYIQREIKLIEGISNLLLIPGTADNLDSYRKALSDEIKVLRGYCLDIETIRI